MVSIGLRMFGAAVVGLAVAVSVGCSDYKSSGGTTDADRDAALVREAERTVRVFKDTDRSMSKFFDSAVGWAVYPTVAKGAAGVGAAHGDGVLYEGGRVVGFTEVAQGTIGLQLGGQTYRELIFFETRSALDHFKSGNMEFQAQASAVAAESGAAANSDFEDGVAVFTMARGGLMFEAAIGGQKFSYRAK